MSGTIDSGDTAWVLVATALVLMMTPYPVSRSKAGLTNVSRRSMS